MRNFTLIRGEWRRGADRVAPGTARALHARGVCRLWIPITPETADALGWGLKATAKHWPRFRFGPPYASPSFVVCGSGPTLYVPVVSRDGGPDVVTFRLYARIPSTYEVIGAAPRKGAPSGWCWEVRPRGGVVDDAHRLRALVDKHADSIEALE